MHQFIWFVLICHIYIFSSIDCSPIFYLQRKKEETLNIVAFNLSIFIVIHSIPLLYTVHKCVCVRACRSLLLGDSFNFQDHSFVADAKLSSHTANNSRECAFIEKRALNWWDDVNCQSKVSALFLTMARMPDCLLCTTLLCTKRYGMKQTMRWDNAKWKTLYSILCT